MAAISYLAWAPAVLIRQHGLEPSEVGFAYGTILLCAATPGVLAGGWLTDAFANRGRTDAPVRVAILALVASIPFAVAMPLMPTQTGALAALAGFSFLAGVMNSLPATSLQAVAPNQLRAQITAIYFLIGNLVSLGLGPTVVAAISDSLLGGPARIGLSLAIVSGVTLLIATLLLTRALKPFRESVEEARQWQETTR